MDENKNIQTDLPQPEITKIKKSDLKLERYNLDLAQEPEVKALIDSILNLSPRAADLVIKILDRKLESLKNSNQKDNKGEE